MCSCISEPLLRSAPPRQLQERQSLGSRKPCYPLILCYPILTPLRYFSTPAERHREQKRKQDSLLPLAGRLSALSDVRVRRAGTDHQDQPRRMSAVRLLYARLARLEDERRTRWNMKLDSPYYILLHPSRPFSFDKIMDYALCSFTFVAPLIGKK